MSNCWRIVVLERSYSRNVQIRKGDVIEVDYDGYRATVKGWEGSGPRGMNSDPAWAVAELARDLGVIPREIVPPGEPTHAERDTPSIPETRDPPGDVLPWLDV